MLQAPVSYKAGCSHTLLVSLVPLASRLTCPAHSMPRPLSSGFLSFLKGPESITEGMNGRSPSLPSNPLPPSHFRDQCRGQGPFRGVQAGCLGRKGSHMGEGWRLPTRGRRLCSGLGELPEGSQRIHQRLHTTSPVDPSFPVSSCRLQHGA